MTDVESLRSFLKSHSPDLLDVSWTNLRNAGYPDYFIKVAANSASIDVALTDFRCLWLSKKYQWEEKFHELNPNIEGDWDELSGHVERIILTKESGKMEIQKESTALSIKYNSSFCQLPVAFALHLNLASADEMYDYITKPLLLVLATFQRRENMLGKALEEKDREIDDLKLSGAQLSSDHLETTRFTYSNWSSQDVESNETIDLLRKVEYSGIHPLENTRTRMVCGSTMLAYEYIKDNPNAPKLCTNKPDTTGKRTTSDLTHSTNNDKAEIVPEEHVPPPPKKIKDKKKKLRL